MTKPAWFSKAYLRELIGGEHLYQHPLNRDVLYTEGAKSVADQGSAHWLLDIIAIDQPAVDEDQVWKLAVLPDRSATLTCEYGNNRVVYCLPFTDFPEPEVTLCVNCGIIHLPIEIF